ncbi:MAG: lysine--tRNA ligase [Patescibacteria group bacterium]
MIWADREAKRLKERGLPIEWADDMKTPSGRIHVGSLRGVIVHDLIYKALKQTGVNAKFSYVFNDMDPMDGMPSYLDAKIWDKYMGQPLYKIPSPEKGAESFAKFYAQEFIDVFNALNCKPQIIWSHELYASGKMDPIVKLFLDESDKVREIYKNVAHAQKAPDWFPYNPICQKCGKIGTTKVHKWDGQYVHYRCEEKMVKWAAGCGYEGKVTPTGESGKLPWKLDWPAHWKVIGVTVESSGKDHMSSGGSYDMAVHLCRDILGTQAPDAMGGYEWFTIGGKKMSSSKGIGSSAREVSSILPPEVFRFMQVRTPIRTHLDFDPYGDTIPNLFDDYDRCFNAYFLKSEGALPKGKQGEVILDFARIIELSEVKPLPKKRLFVPRFRTVANLIKAKSDNILVFFEKQKKEPLTEEEKGLLEERIAYAKIYLEKYADAGQHTANEERAFIANGGQDRFVKKLASNLSLINIDDKTAMQEAVFTTIKQIGIKPREAFTVFYQVLTGKPYGVKAGDLISDLGVKKTIELLSKDKSQASDKTVNLYPTLNQPEIFSIDQNMASKYPSLNIGIAIIKNVNIQKSNPGLKRMLDGFKESQSGLSNEVISAYKEVQTYRKLYKEMGLDWHSKRPSPEALLRRVAQKKDLYEINTCVDAYNLIVMKHRVSIGAFDLDKLKLPTILRFPKPGEKILLLGDKEPTEYKETDLAYFDRTGGYNIYFNYRDAQRTAVSVETKNIILNIDGIYDITRDQVEQSLKESVEMITKFCGGEVELAGIVSA